MALENVITTLVLDVIDHDQTQGVVKAIALDSKTRYVQATIVQHGLDYDVDPNAVVTLTILRPDNVGVQVTGSVVDVDNADRTGTIKGVYAELTQAALAKSGTLRAQFKITSGEQILRTEIFAVKNGVALDAETSEWAGEYQGYNLDELVQSVNSAVATVNEMESDVSDLKEELYSVTVEWTESGYIKDDGTVRGYTNFSCSDYIYVSDTVHLKANLYYVPSGYYHVGCYDSSYAFIGGLYEGTGGQQVADTDLALPDGTAYIRIATYTSQANSVKLQVLFKVSEAVIRSKSNEAAISNRISVEDLANNLFVAIALDNEWYFEQEERNVYVKAYPYLLVRGGSTAADSYTIQWSTVTTDLSQYVATSPKGVANCIKLEHTKTLCLDIANKKLAIKTTGNQRYPNYIDIVTCFEGRVTGSISEYLSWYNHSSIDVMQSKLADVAYVPDAMKTALTTINEDATYNYPNMAKLLWISDVHWNNDCYAYLKYLADFGQYDALIISGDLNYYQFEQTLEATKTGMSELARLWNSYYRGKTIVLPIRGNHDGHVGYSDYTSEMFANAVIKPFHDCEDNGYYYYDLEKYRIRVVMLNSSDDAQSRKGFKSAEVAWFSSVINSVESGWSVISVSHHPIVAQLNTESSLAGNSSGIVSAINSFVANKQDCRYIAHLSGHTHRDMMDKISGVNYVSIIDSSTDQSDYSADIICINQTTQTVNLLRSGEGQNRSFTY